MSIIDQLKERVKGQEAEPQGMLITYPDLITLTVKEVNELCASRPEHAQSKLFASAVKDLPPTAEVHVERADVQAILENGESILEITVETVDNQKRRVARRKMVKAQIAAFSDE